MSRTEDRDVSLASADGPPRPPIDVADLLARCQQSAALARRLAGRFVTEAPGQLAGVRAAVVSRDGAGAAKLLHKLRGSLGVFGAGTALDLAQRLEDRAATGDFGDSEALMATLEREVERARAALEHLEV